MSKCKVNLSAPTKAVEILLQNSDLDVVASGLGSLNVDIDPGIYQIQYRAGNRMEHSLVALRSGEIFENHAIDLPFATPMPVEGTSTSRESFRQAVQTLSQNPIRFPDANSQFMLFVRSMSESSSGVPLRVHPDTMRGWKLLREDATNAIQFHEVLPIHGAEEWMGFSVSLPAGGYILETLRGSDVFRQSVWLNDNWITGLFIPNSSAGVLPEKASVQMSRCGEGWQGFESETQEVIRMSELALIALRERRNVLPSSTLRQLLHGKFLNPMLGIIGAHTMLLEQHPNPQFLKEVLNNLALLVPGHPDVISLQKMAVASKLLEVNSPSVSWPPMLAASFQGLLAADANGQDAITLGSVAETVAPFVVHSGTWTTWRPLTDHKPTSMQHGDPALDETMQLLGMFDFDALSPAAGQLRRLKRVNLPKENSQSDGASWQRLLRYLQESIAINENESILDVLKSPSLSADLALPRNVVQRLVDLAKIGIKADRRRSGFEKDGLRFLNRPPEEPPLTGSVQ